MFDFSVIVDEFPKDRKLQINSRKAARGVIFYNGKLLMVKTSLGDYKFPGGGVKSGENESAALYREIVEETGYTDVTIGPRIGHAFEQNIDIHNPSAMFQMDSDYYLCVMNSEVQESQRLEGYEIEMAFTPEFVSIEDAYECNRALLDKGMDIPMEGSVMSVSEWAERETKALAMLKDSLTDKLLSGIFACGQRLKNADRSVLKVDDKAGHANFVTNYDKMIQDELKKFLLKTCPDALFIGEENDENTVGEAGERTFENSLAFIVDPIDGTTNFMKDYRQSCISVGVTLNGEPVAGVVYQPYSGEMFCAEKGKGAFVNGSRIHVSNCDMDHALVVFGTAPYYEELRRKSFAKAEEFCGRCVDVRRSGSAAIDLCNVAIGRADLYFEYKICPWDIAAGSVIVTEAGGKISQVDGSPINLVDKGSILATNGITHMI